nr:hypothetical protein [Pseudomonas sp. PDM20]
MDAAQVPDRARFEVDGAFLDLPVHAGLALPVFDGLLLGELIAQAMPRHGTNVSHLFDEMSHKNLLARGHWRAPMLGFSSEHRRAEKVREKAARGSEVLQGRASFR